MPVRQLHGIGQKDDRGFEPLGAVHRQDADLVALALAEIALDLDVAGRDPAQKSLQRGHVLALVGQRQREKLLDRIGRFRPETFEDRAPPVVGPGAGPENFGVQLERRDEIGAGEQRAEALVSLPHRRLLARETAQAGPQPVVAAIIGEPEQLVLREAEQRPFQHRRQGQIVFRQQQKAAERDQILHREFVGERQAVGAGDRHAALLSAPATGRRQIRCAGAPARSRRRPAARVRAAPAARRRSSQPAIVAAIARARRVRGSSGRRGPALSPRLGDIIGIGRHRRPQLDEPGLSGIGRDMADRGAVERHPVGRLFAAGTPHRPRRSSGSAARNEISSGTSTQSRLAAFDARPRNGAASRQRHAGRRAESCRSTASGRRPRRSCERRSWAPSPAKNSAASAATISHCSGLVSCASSIRMWSSPPSSLNRTHGAIPGRRSRSSAFSTRSS